MLHGLILRIFSFSIEKILSGHLKNCDKQEIFSDMKYIFGPVPSRRLGLSLGVDLLPPKTCNMDCIYCELGKGRGTVCQVREYTPFEEIRDEIQRVAVENPTGFDCLTFTASGEPTLHSRLGELIEFARATCGKPIVVLTNAGLVGRKEIRRNLSQADFILPSLDAATAKAFRKINRPDPCIKLEEVINGLSRLKQEMQGQMWLEILFVQGINDSPQEVRALKDAVSRIQPDRVQLNTVVRPPAEDFARPVPRRRMEEIRSELGHGAEIIVDFTSRLREGSSLLLESEILDVLKRRPLSCKDIKELFGEYKKVDEILARLMKDGLIDKKQVASSFFYCTSSREDQLGGGL